MSYLLDKKIKRKKLFYILLSLFLCLILFYFRLGIWQGLSVVSQKVFRPVLIVGNNLGEKFKNLNNYFISKNSLSKQNQDLKSKLNEMEARMLNYNSLISDEASLKEILNRKDPKINMTLAAILAKPNQSLYDTLLIDVGTEKGIKIGETVFALGNVPIGRVDLVYANSSKVVLFSNPGEKTPAVITGKNIFLELVGRGGGNFEMIMPKGFSLQKEDPIVMPGLNSYVLAITQAIISDPRDPFTKALLISPVNIQELKFVEVTH